MSIKSRFGDGEIVWRDRKRFFGLPLSFTRYYLVKNGEKWSKLFTSIGFLSRIDEEVQLFRIFDISMYQSFVNKIFNVGSIALYCNDESQSEIILRRVKNPVKVRNLLANMIEENRTQKKLHLGEFYS